MNKILPVCIEDYLTELQIKDKTHGNIDAIYQIIERDFEVAFYSDAIEEDGTLFHFTPGRELKANALKVNSAWTSLPVWKLSRYYDEEVPDEQKLLLLSYAAHRSIIGKRIMAKTNNEYVKARMAGYNTPLGAKIPPEIAGMSKYRMAATRDRLCQETDFVFITPQGVNGYIFGFGISLEDLCYNYLSSKKGEDIKSQQRAAMAAARKRIMRDESTRRKQ